MTPQDAYVSFLLRLQRTRSDDSYTWVISLQSSKTGEMRRFSSLDTFIWFLQAEFQENEDSTVPKVVERKKSKAAGRE